MNDFLDAWRINNRVNLFFLDAVPPESLYAKPPKGKTVGGHFAHLHMVRLMWLKPAAPELLGDLEKLPDDASVEQIKAALTGSAEAVEKLLEKGFAEGRIKGFKPHAAAFFSYLMAHEGHHRGMAELALRELGTPLSDKVSYGIWEWGVR